MQANQYQTLLKGFVENGTTEETLFTGLASEVGEVMSERVKETRKGLKRDEEILDELSDVLWYIATIADKRGSSLEKLMDHNIDKLIERKLWGKRESNCVSCNVPSLNEFCEFCLNWE